MNKQLLMRALLELARIGFIAFAILTVILIRAMFFGPDYPENVSFWKMYLIILGLTATGFTTLLAWHTGQYNRDKETA